MGAVKLRDSQRKNNRILGAMSRRTRSEENSFAGELVRRGDSVFEMSESEDDEKSEK